MVQKDVNGWLDDDNNVWNGQDTQDAGSSDLTLLWPKPPFSVLTKIRVSLKLFCFVLLKNLNTPYTYTVHPVQKGKPGKTDNEIKDRCPLRCKVNICSVFWIHSWWSSRLYCSKKTITLCVQQTHEYSSRTKNMNTTAGFNIKHLVILFHQHFGSSQSQTNRFALAFI